MDAALLAAAQSPIAQARSTPGKAAALGAGSVEASARKAAAEFESVLLTTMLEGMFAGLDTEGPGGGGKSEKTYRSMMLGEYAKEIASNGGLGIADHVYREILAVQENVGK